MNVTDIARPAIAPLFNKGACVGGIYKRPGYTKGTRPKLAFQATVRGGFSAVEPGELSLRLFSQSLSP